MYHIKTSSTQAYAGSKLIIFIDLYNYTDPLNHNQVNFHFPQ